jgi:putative ABC transport system substrate-binding protein
MMRPRDFITLLGGAAAAWPLTARAQQPTMPVIGFLGSESAQSWTARVRAFHQGLAQGGFVEHQNVAIEYLWAENQPERLPMLAAELVSRHVSVIAAPGSVTSALAAKAATTTIPIVFAVGVNPVEFGLVASLNRPGGNLTGVTNLNTEVGPKRLELLHELVPKAAIVGLLVNPANPALAETSTKDFEAAARTLGIELHVVPASTESDFESAFAALIQLRAGGLVIGGDPFFNSHSDQLATLAVRHVLPTVFSYPDFVAAGGLMSYGSSLTEGPHLAGVYTGRILKGEKPSDLPVQQSTRIELLINLKTAKALGIDVPPALLIRADEVIE